MSVIVPVYNRETLIAATIESIWAQSYPNLELVAVDDASTDGSYAALESLQRRSPIPMRVARRATNGGMNPTLNAALALSSGELIAILDSDDLLTPGRFETQVARLCDDPDLMVVYGNGRQLLPDGSIGGRVHSPETRALLSRSPAEILDYIHVRVNPIFIQTLLIRRSFIEAIGGFDEEMLSNDWALNIRAFRRLTRQGRHAYVDEDCFLYRLHDGNMHKDFDYQSRLVLQVFERYTPAALRRRALAQACEDRGQVAMAIGRHGAALRYFTRSQWHRPRPRHFLRTLAPHKWALLASILPAPIVSALRTVWRLLKAATSAQQCPTSPAAETTAASPRSDRGWPPARRRAARPSRERR